MARRFGDSDHSAFFFLGSFDPPGLRFHVSNVPLGDDGFIEIMGSRFGLWWPTRLARDFDDVRRRANDWAHTIASLHYVGTGGAIDARIERWVEALDVHAAEAVLGFVDPHYRLQPLPKRPMPRTAPIRRAITAAGGLKTLARTDARAAHIKRAAWEAWRARLDPTDEAFLSAFRALECLRRSYDPDWNHRERAWKTLAADLSPDGEPYSVLGKAAEAVRHGERPEHADYPHAVNVARPRRDEMIEYSRDLVERAMSKYLPTVWHALAG